MPYSRPSLLHAWLCLRAQCTLCYVVYYVVPDLSSTTTYYVLLYTKACQTTNSDVAIASLLSLAEFWLAKLWTRHTKAQPLAHLPHTIANSFSSIE